MTASPKTYCVFDLLVSDGADIMSMPLYDRKHRRSELISQPLPSVLMVGTLDTEGEWLYQQALLLRLEGIVGKRLDSLYYPGMRSPDWLTVKRPEQSRPSASGTHAVAEGLTKAKTPCGWPHCGVANHPQHHIQLKLSHCHPLNRAYPPGLRGCNHVSVLLFQGCDEHCGARDGRSLVAVCPQQRAQPTRLT